jgi:hypothetical protein
LDTYKGTQKSAHISWIGYNPKCSVYQNLEKSMGTRDMVLLAINAISQRYKWVETFTLTDATEIRCQEELIVPLFPLSIINNEKSYYEKHFKATIQDKEMNKQYRSCITKMSQENKVSFPEFVSLAGLRGDDTIKALEHMYINSRTYREFFKTLKKETKDDFCKFIYPWGYEFITKYILEGRPYQNMTWVISTKDIPRKEYFWQPTIDTIAIDALRTSFKKYYEGQSGGHHIGGYEDIYPSVSRHHIGGYEDIHPSTSSHNSQARRGGSVKRVETEMEKWDKEKMGTMDVYPRDKDEYNKMFIPIYREWGYKGKLNYDEEGKVKVPTWAELEEDQRKQLREENERAIQRAQAKFATKN